MLKYTAWAEGARYPQLINIPETNRRLVYYGFYLTSDIYPKSKYTFIDFWASWCAPCRAENPNVVKAFEKYGKKGLTILSVSLDTKADLWKEAIQKDGMPWLHVSQLKGFDEPAAVLYGIKMIPQNVLVDANGKIVATNLRGYALEDKLKTLIKD